jgi:hypothetical protein
MKLLDKNSLFGADYEQDVVRSVINAAIAQSAPKDIHAIFNRIKHLEQLPANDVSLSTLDLIYTLFGGQVDIDFAHHDQEYERYIESHQEEVPRGKSLLDADGGLLTAELFAGLICKSNKTVSRLFNQKKIIGIQKNEGATQPRYYPAWQVNNGEVYPCITQIIDIFDSAGTEVLRFFLLPATELNGQRPLDYLRTLGDEKVIALAKSRTMSQQVNKRSHG